ncbi:hypothetical protein VitviT2T_009874 [Vitis vinifera]|uniref:GH16 domain-containing protein n=1 Tax=Vitis vinifera TaxID=29760 RepID=A0ABY9C6X2_VITVI|nr:hypothetical protein VitviT2T_009874 [Vitis vinifera]
MFSRVRGVAPRKCIDVPFNRNYVPTWVFNHIKSYNGGFEIQLILDKCTRTITVFYPSSQNLELDEINFEFSGNKKQRIYLWFDPTKAFHSYSVLWNKYLIVLLVDDVPMVVFKNNIDLRVKFLFRPTHEGILKPSKGQQTSYLL